ncbi:MAG: excinuclease ABC subunit UvrA [Candidatus Moranbacteria bacterium]|nr:excinuclease ABC subunit UvrA [Candidatus Moranbacteria bacterium]
MKKIIIRGAREHNLKNINLELPRDKFIVFTGVSGSGKSTLAFDTIFAEGQRRYLESLSSYARQFLGQMDKPDVDVVEGMSPTISINQKSVSRNPRSTVGTITEIYDYLRLLFAKVGTPHCKHCGKEIKKVSLDEMIEEILESFQEGELIEIYAPVVRGKKGEYHTLLKNLNKKGYEKALVNGKIVNLEASRFIDLDRYKRHDIEVLVDEVEIDAAELERINESVEQALNLAGGMVKIKQGKKITTFNQQMMCVDCNYSFAEVEPRSFSFNSPYGACPKCMGLGKKFRLTQELAMPDKNKTIGEGGILPWSYRKNNWFGLVIDAAARQYRIATNDRIKDIPKYKLDKILYGEEEPISLKIRTFRQPSRIWTVPFAGIMNFLNKRYQDTDSEKIRKEIEKYMVESICDECQGARLKKESLLVKIGGKSISELTLVSIEELLAFFNKIKLNKSQKIIAERINKEIINRLNFLKNVGLSYLSLNRAANTLSGGESQRIRLASQVGAALVGVIYILDEPSIGLHARDNDKLLKTLKHLRDLGNTVIVIEHDEETMKSCDWLVDIGPGAGDEGGRIVENDKLEKALKNKESITVQYLNKEKQIEPPEQRRQPKNKKLSIEKASEHNLKNLNVAVPLELFTCVTGVSGSGKSTLVNDIIYKTLSRQFYRSLEQPGKHEKIKGTHWIDKVVNVDQSPIGRTPRSNPATYTQVFTPIRELFAATRDARVKGFGPGRFSFNVNGGRCDNCQGEGFLKVEMQFLPDVYLPCDVCNGARYKKETLKVEYKTKNIAEVLDMNVSEALEFFRDIPQVYDILKIIEDVGLGYIKLGQPATTLSGGEAQRVKLAKELSKRSTRKTFYILDEPTTGLHFDDVKKLLDVTQRLVDNQNTVLMIEHNLDVIKSADWLIDLGPEGGDKGGRLVAQGSPEELIKYEQSYTGRYLKKLFEN